MRTSMINCDVKETAKLPFALLMHEKAVVDEETLMGDPDQAWTWTPAGDLKPEELRIYATGGNTTTRQTGYQQWDTGEFS
jgi:hypothetical protein